MLKLRPYPGPLPSKPSPRAGQKIIIEVSGLPPYKQIRASIRNPRHPHHTRFLKLREAALKVMGGRRWTDRPVSVNLTMYAPAFEERRVLCEYLSGVNDTLDRSHGECFTYLPIVFQDDCQVSRCKSQFNSSRTAHYVVEIDFLRQGVKK
jgi:hypothetical protein